MTAPPAADPRVAFRCVRRLLAVRLDALGDVLMTTPALHAARHAAGGRHVTLLTSPAGAAAGQLVDAVDEVIVYDAPWVKATAPRTAAAVDRTFIAALAARGFDAAIIFTVYSQNPLPAAMMCYLADIPQRLAYCRENPYQLLTAWLAEVDPDAGPRHEVQRQLDLVAAVGWRSEEDHLRITVPPAASLEVDARLADWGLLDTARWVVVHPGASAPSRRYPEEHFAAVIMQLSREHGFHVLLTGSADERPLLERLARHGDGRARALAGELDLAGLAALIARAPVLISNNTGPAHVAAAVGTPVVDLYALTNPQHTPWRVTNRVLYRDVPCRNCYRSVCPEGHHHCLRGVEPREVVAAARELWAGRTAGESSAQRAAP